MSTIKTTSNIEHTVCDRTVCEAVGVSEYVYVNVDAWVEITVNGRPLTVNFQNGHDYKANNYDCPSNQFIVGSTTDVFVSKLDRLSDDADQDDIDDYEIEVDEFGHKFVVRPSK